PRRRIDHDRDASGLELRRLAVRPGQRADRGGDRERLEEQLEPPLRTPERAHRRIPLRNLLPEREAGHGHFRGGLAPEAEENEEEKRREAPEGGGSFELHSSTPASRR